MAHRSNQEGQDMATDRERIAALEQQNYQLKSELDALKPPKPAAPQDASTIEEEGVRVSYPRSYPIAMPTTAQFEKLLAIVARVYPRSVPAYHVNDEYFRGFVGSFERIASLRRSPGLNTALGRGVQYWADEAYSWLRERGTPAETTNGSFWAAVVASGDVNFSLRADGILPYYGLTFDTEARKVSPGAWQRVLSDCQPRAPVAPPAPLQQNQRTAEVRILSDWGSA
jgi:hypothetical protein